MATRLDQDSKKMLLAQARPVGGFRAQQASELIEAAALRIGVVQGEMTMIEADLVAGKPVSESVANLAEALGSAIWELTQAMTSMGLSTEAVLGVLRERALTGTMMDLGFLIRTQLFVAVGPLAGEELAGSLTAGLPIAGDEVPSYAVSPETPPEPPLLENTP